MKKYQYSILVLVVLAFSQLAQANRFGDAWMASHHRFQRHFYPENRAGAGAVFLLSSTTVTSVSSLAFTFGGDMLKQAQLRQHFIDENLYAIKIDSAKGQGEFVQTLAILSGCEDASAQSLFAAKIRSQFKNVYGATFAQDSASIANQIDNMIDSDPEMQNSCPLENAS